MTAPHGAKLVGGVWLPAGERHFVEMMSPGAKRHRLVDGKWTYQLHKLEAAMTHVRERRVALDVGAHVGLWSMHLVKLFDRVHAFEPVPLHAELYALNVTAANATLHRLALGAHEGRVALRVPPEQTGGAHVAGAGELPMTRLDALDIAPVDFVKIDVEGYELPVVEGARETLSRWRPVVVVEQKGNDARHFGGRRDEALAYLSALGMKPLACISGDHILGW